MPGGRSATTADDARSRFHKAGGMLGELLRRQIVTSVGAGNTGVRLRDDGKRRVFSHFGYDRNEFVGSHGTVDAYRVRAERGQAYADGTSQPVKVRPFSSNVMVTNTGSDVASFAARSAAFAS